jgi:hypothetical protein
VCQGDGSSQKKLRLYVLSPAKKSQKSCLQPKKLGLLRIVSSLDVSIGDKQLLQTGIVVDLMFC